MQERPQGPEPLEPPELLRGPPAGQGGGILAQAAQKRGAAACTAAPRSSLHFAFAQLMAMAELLGSSCLACLGMDSFRMPSSYLADTSSGFTSPT